MRKTIWVAAMLVTAGGVAAVAVPGGAYARPGGTCHGLPVTNPYLGTDGRTTCTARLVVYRRTRAQMPANDNATASAAPRLPSGTGHRIRRQPGWSANTASSGSRPTNASSRAAASNTPTHDNERLREPGE